MHPKIINALKEHAHEKDYLPTLGLLKLRESIACYYKKRFNYNFSPDHILIGPGSKELIFQCLFVLEGPVIIPAPSWVSYGPQVNVRGKHIIRAMTRRENNYKLTGAELKQVCSTLPEEEQKVLIINSPNNPTGQVYSDTEMADLVKVCRQEQVIIISDEIYAMIDFTGRNKSGFLNHYPEGTIVTAGLSKSHSAGGYRLGFIAAPPNMTSVIQGLSALVSETFSAVSAPIQYAAVQAYSGDSEIEEYLENCCKIHKCVGNYIAEELNSMAVDCPDPEGAFYVFPDFSKYKEELKERYSVSTGKDLAESLLVNSSVALLPGSDFYMSPSSLTTRMATVDYDGAEVYQAANEMEFQLNKDFLKKNTPLIVEGLNAIKDYLI
ncbi:MAG: pyridoxal phosphate-dependent aminotransferase [Bdellovibrionales bacterium]|nr:pyridoxal phosphate-dependent aminotransferase [Bdellovibrionales bacterium]